MGGLSIFRKKYVIRRFKPQEVIDGYITSGHEDMVTELNVQPADPDSYDALPEGERRFKRLKSFGDLQLTAANQETGTLGDWLYYYGSWYRCVSAVPWDHTILWHCRAEFAEIPESELDRNTKPPTLEVNP